MNSLPPPPPPPYPPPKSSIVHLVEHNRTDSSHPQQKNPDQIFSTSRKSEDEDEFEDVFAGTSFASVDRSTTDSLHSNSNPASATKNEVIFRVDGAENECRKGTRGRENYSPKKSEVVKDMPKTLKPQSAAVLGSITLSIKDTWKAKKRRSSHRKGRKSSPVSKSEACNAYTDKAPVKSRNNQKSPTNNFFMQMGDDEVGNHNISDVQTEATDPTASNSSGSKGTNFAMWGKEGRILFQPHAPAGNDDEYYFTPGRGKTRTGLRKSPQSVISSISNEQTMLMEGVGSSISSKDLALTSFPRHARKSGKHVRESSAQYPNRHGSSCDDSDSVANDEDASDVDDASAGTSIAKTISDSLPPVLNIFHAFIIGTPCWTPSGNADFISGLSSRCVEGARAHVAHECNGDEDEERSNVSPGHSNDDNDASFYSSEDSSRYCIIHGGVKKKKAIAIDHKAKKNRTSRKPPSRRRGRSPTIKEGYNSDGESLRSRSRGSRASMSSRGSLSLSVDSSEGYETSQSCSKDSHASMFSDPPELPIEKRGPVVGASFGVVVGTGGGGDVATSYCVNAIPGNLGLDMRHGYPSGVGMNAIVDENIRFPAANGSAVDASGLCIGSNEAVVFSSSTVAVENVLSYDQAMWLSMTQEKPSLTEMVDTRDENDSKIVGSENSESSLDGGSLPKEATIEEFFKKILTVGIQLKLNDPPASGCVQRLREGKIFLKFGTHNKGVHENPILQWTDGRSISYTIDLLDIEMIRQPTESEVKDIYPFAVSAHSFFVSNRDGSTLLFEADDELQMKRITTSLRGVIARLAKKIVTGESDWVGQMMLVSTAQVVKFDELDGMLSSAMSNVSDRLVEKTAFAVPNESDIMSRKAAWMKQVRERRARVLRNKT